MLSLEYSVNYDEIAVNYEEKTFFTACQYVQRTHTLGGRITIHLVSSLTRLDLTKPQNMLLITCTETTEYKPIKLEASHTNILPPKVTVLCFILYLLTCLDTNYEHLLLLNHLSSTN